jgi:phosphoserine aminotransferase
MRFLDQYELEFFTSMFTLSPGPSQISPETKHDIRRAIETGVLELSHRSTRFTEISKRCDTELRKYLRIPEEYRIFYFDSATQVWHSMMTNLVRKSSFHFVTGAFSAKAYEASRHLHKEALKNEVSWGEQCNIQDVKIPARCELITACFNETSTGVKMTDSEVRLLRRKNPKAILAIDTTSSAGMIPNNITNADVWYFSVQKGFGLPAGLAIAIIAPRAYKRSIELSKSRDNKAGIWSWERLDEMMRDGLHQTPHTPNVLNIYLLGKQCARWNKRGGASKIMNETLAKKKMIEKWIADKKECRFFVSDQTHRSDTVAVVESSHSKILEAKKRLARNKIELGAGYGKIKLNTFRIANFPAIHGPLLRRTLRILDGVFDK